MDGNRGNSFLGISTGGDGDKSPRFGRNNSFNSVATSRSVTPAPSENEGILGLFLEEDHVISDWLKPEDNTAIEDGSRAASLSGRSPSPVPSTLGKETNVLIPFTPPPTSRKVDRGPTLRVNIPELSPHVAQWDGGPRRLHDDETVTTSPIELTYLPRAGTFRSRSASPTRQLGRTSAQSADEFLGQAYQPQPTNVRPANHDHATVNFPAYAADPLHVGQSMLVADGLSPRAGTTGSGMDSPSDFGLPPPRTPRGRTLWYFGADNRIRASLFSYILTKPWYYGLALLTLFQLIILTHDTVTRVQTSLKLWAMRTTWVAWAMLVLYFIYTVNMVSHIIAFGGITTTTISPHTVYHYIRHRVVPLLHGAFSTRDAHVQPRPTGQELVTEGDNASLVDDKMEASAIAAAANASATAHIPTIEAEDVDPVTDYPVPFLYSSWNRLEALSVVCFWISMGISLGGKPSAFVMILSGLAHIRLLRLLDVLQSTRIVLNALKAALPLLKDVFLFIFLFLIAYSITGLQSFNASLRRTCVWVDPAHTAPNYTSSQICGSYFDLAGVRQPYVFENGVIGQSAKGFTCPKYSYCVSSENPYDNTFSFDNIFNSLELVFVVMSQNTYSDIMYNIIDAEFLVSCLFFVTGIVVLNYWLISLLVAVMVSSFDIVWSSIENATNLGSGSTDTPISHTWYISRTKLGKMYLRVLPVFSLIVCLDVAFQAVWSSDPKTFIIPWQIALSSVFALDILLRFLLYLPYWKVFLRSYVNIVDLVLALCNIGILGAINHPIVYAWLTLFQLLRFYRFVALFPVAEKMFRTVFGNYRSISDLTLFYFGLTFIASLVACQMFRGVVPYQADGEVINVSFYNLANAFIGMYQLSSTENWTDVMYNAIENGPSLISRIAMGIVFCLWLAFANFVVVNLFIAIMTQNLSSAISNKRVEQVKLFVTKYLQPHHLAGASDFSDAFLAIRSGIRKLVHNWTFKGRNELRAANRIEQTAEKEIIAEFLANTRLDDQELSSGPSTDSSNIHSFPVFNMPKIFNPVVKLLRRFPKGYYEAPAHAPVQKAPLEASDNSSGNRESDPFRDTGSREPDPFRDPDLDADAAEPEDYVHFLFEHRTRTQTHIFKFSQNDPRFDRPLWLFSVDNPFRKFCQRIAPSSHGKRASGIEPKKWIGYSVAIAMLLATVAMVVCSCINTPYYHLETTKNTGVSSSKWTWLTYLDLLFTLLFLQEFIVKVVADGFYYTPNAYTYDPWNGIDFVVLLSMVVTLFNDIFNGPIARYSRALMALRALRLITVTPRAQAVFHDVFLSGFKNIVVAAFIGSCVVIPYSVWGQNIFGGRLKTCNDSNVNDLSDCVGEYLNAPSNWEIWAPRVLSNPYFDYDSFGQALMTQFGILSLEGWIDVLNAVISIAGPNMNSQNFASYFNATYAIIYNYIGTVLVMTMFLTIIIRNYALSRDTAFLTPDQLAWHYVKGSLKLLKPKMKLPLYRPGTVRYVTLQSIMQKRSVFNQLQLWILAAATIILMVFYYPATSKVVRGFEIALSVFSLLYFSTMVIKLWALGYRLFIRDTWNLYAVVVTAAEAILGLVLVGVNASWLSAMQRAAIIALLALWIPQIASVRHLFRIATGNVSELATIIQTWFILFLTFAIGFNQTFGLTKIGPNSTETQNFRTVPKALILLFKMSTGEGWNQIMTDYLISEPYCVQGPFFESDCGSKWLAYLLFCSWNVISMYIFCNLFVSVIYDTFWYIYHRTPSQITSEDIELFQSAWQRFDPFGKGLMKTSCFYDFLKISKGYFSIGIYSTDPDYNVKTILERTNARRSFVNPYNVDYEAINEYLEDLPVLEFRRKRELYQLFCAQVFYQSVQRHGIGFHRLLKQFPLYRSMDPAKVMDLRSFLKLKVMLYNLRIEMAAGFIVRRWRLNKSMRAKERTGARPRPKILVHVPSPG